MVDEFDKRWESPEWKLNIDDKKEGVIIHMKPIIDNISSVKSTACIDRTPMDVFRVLGNDTYH